MNATGDLTADEVEMGWVAFGCDRHGFLVAATPKATVVCRCGKFARRLRHGRLVDRDTLRPTDAKPRTVNASGHPFLHACGDCGEDFGGRTLQARHRVGRAPNKRCLTPVEMGAKGWHLDARGRWREKHPDAGLRARVARAVTPGGSTRQRADFAAGSRRTGEDGHGHVREGLAA